jgi:serine/threonine protein phosphatase Stp1
LRLKVHSAGISDPGLKREVNEDSILVEDGSNFWAVADGMGGHENGAFASGHTVKCLSDQAFVADFEDAKDLISQRIFTANQQIWEAGAGQDAAGTMGTTLVSLVIRGHEFAVLWVGDSRAYIYRRGGLFQLSTDHTHVQDLIDEGVLSEEEAEGHPMSHVLSRALGVQETVRVDIMQDMIDAGDTFLLCSDGLTGPVSEAVIREIIANHPLQEAAQLLIKAAHENGAPDNVSVVLVGIEEDI